MQGSEAEKKILFGLNFRTETSNLSTRGGKEGNAIAERGNRRSFGRRAKGVNGCVLKWRLEECKQWLVSGNGERGNRINVGCQKQPKCDLKRISWGASTTLSPSIVCWRKIAGPAEKPKSLGKKGGRTDGASLAKARREMLTESGGFGGRN